MFRTRSGVLRLMAFVLFSVSAAFAQGSSSVDSLRSQLSDTQQKEAALQTRLKQLDEDLRPENIEKFFALNGSTQPEVLREQRRKQLESQKALLQTELDQLATSRARLEASIATAEAAAYRQSAVSSESSPPPVVSPGNTPTAKAKQTKPPARRQRTARRRRRG